MAAFRLGAERHRPVSREGGCGLGAPRGRSALSCERHRPFMDSLATGAPSDALRSDRALARRGARLRATLQRPKAGSRLRRDHGAHRRRAAREHLERSGFVIMEKPPSAGGATVGFAATEACSLEILHARR
jgi:hypothetical protein